ncbi:MAG: hypothetical protein COV52_09035 [Gammaproteobacteria bacterium CG11_big_fil_rev_8_21_14_0_20_46_22]|nr:MAG: hypothetical protein COW05_01650 [Gammaproteobacteria bacterium CG12_big_fil_rev_8_21_14_0_65_46_12]PIR10421.1 MAG: hypothetical protein COV52_09035 [Gammaproteobacteria bacterium CG11_big_fil_rev_8_21_14_0_20_46_22]
MPKRRVKEKKAKENKAKALEKEIKALKPAFHKWARAMCRHNAAGDPTHWTATPRPTADLAVVAMLEAFYALQTALSKALAAREDTEQNIEQNARSAPGNPPSFETPIGFWKPPRQKLSAIMKLPAIERTAAFAQELYDLTQQASRLAGQVASEGVNTEEQRSAISDALTGLINFMEEAVEPARKALDFMRDFLLKSVGNVQARSNAQPPSTAVALETPADALSNNDARLAGLLAEAVTTLSALADQLDDDGVVSETMRATVKQTIADIRCFHLIAFGYLPEVLAAPDRLALQASLEAQSDDSCDNPFKLLKAHITNFSREALKLSMAHLPSALDPDLEPDLSAAVGDQKFMGRCLLVAGVFLGLKSSLTSFQQASFQQASLLQADSEAAARACDYGSDDDDSDDASSQARSNGQPPPSTAVALETPADALSNDARLARLLAEAVALSALADQLDDNLFSNGVVSKVRTAVARAIQAINDICRIQSTGPVSAVLADPGLLAPQARLKPQSDDSCEDLFKRLEAGVTRLSRKAFELSKSNTPSDVDFAERCLLVCQVFLSLQRSLHSLLQAELNATKVCIAALHSAAAHAARRSEDDDSNSDDSDDDYDSDDDDSDDDDSNNVGSNNVGSPLNKKGA